MAASSVVVSLLVVCFGGLSTQLPQQDLVSVTVASNVSPTPNNIDNSTAAVKCATARGVPGSCVDRQYCDYSTYAVDLTLYAPRHYKQPCADNESCCPFSYQIAVESKNTWEDKQITSDENDN